MSTEHIAQYPRSKRAFLYWLEELEIQVAQVDTQALDKSHLTRTVRTSTFMLEALFRLHKKRDAFFETGLRLIKSLEDSIGAYDYHHTMFEYALGMNVPTHVVARIETHFKKAEQTLQHLLSTLWQTSPPFDELRAGIYAFDFGSIKEDQRFLRKRLKKRIEKVIALEPDFTDLEEGLHEYRRQVRWFPMYFYALRGLLRFNNSHPVEAFRPLILTPLAQSKYGQLDESDPAASPILMSQSLYLGFSKLISQLGDIKDSGQIFEYFENILVEDFNLSKTTAHTQVAQWFGLPKHLMSQIKAQGHQLYRQAEAQKLFTHLRHVFKKK